MHNYDDDIDVRIAHRSRLAMCVSHFQSKVDAHKKYEQKLYEKNIIDKKNPEL